MKQQLLIPLLVLAIVLAPELAIADDSSCGGINVNSNKGRLNISMEPPPIPGMTDWNGQAAVFIAKLVVEDGKKKYVKENPGEPVKKEDYGPGMDSDSFGFPEGTILIVDAEMWVYTSTGAYKITYSGLIKISGKDNN